MKYCEMPISLVGSLLFGIILSFAANALVVTPARDLHDSQKSAVSHDVRLVSQKKEITQGVYRLDDDLRDTLPNLILYNYQGAKTPEDLLANFVPCSASGKAGHTICLRRFSSGTTDEILERAERERVGTAVKYELILASGERLVAWEVRGDEDVFLEDGAVVSTGYVHDVFSEKYTTPWGAEPLVMVNFQPFLSGQGGWLKYVRCTSKSGTVKWENVYFLKKKGAVLISNSGDDFVKDPIVGFSDIVVPYHSDMAFVTSGLWAYSTQRHQKRIDFVNERPLPNLAFEIVLETGLPKGETSQLRAISLNDILDLYKRNLDEMIKEGILQEIYLRPTYNAARKRDERIMRNNEEFTERVVNEISKRYFKN